VEWFDADSAELHIQVSGLEPSVVEVELGLAEHDDSLAFGKRRFHCTDHGDVGDDGDRHVDVGITERQIEIARSGAPTKFCDLTIDPNATESAYPVRE
jgi:hypothetical protein